ncbi:hypothetical protein EDWATA_03238 [Edwardsiella tarda ATCC 23685]|uniref:Uncharacterized protein n=1 Tax=Edwardsiella tarda ATCC 23685 TaxID=500638 RepID=D4F8Y4_EDWTA|nr:hypothetical protein EDWATA_03238 [Edwardsiella tarda ATCC 23685]
MWLAYLVAAGRETAAPRISLPLLGVRPPPGAPMAKNLPFFNYACFYLN